MYCCYLAIDQRWAGDRRNRNGVQDGQSDL